MAKKAVGPYDQYNDLQLLLRYLKLCEDYEQFVFLPNWATEEDVRRRAYFLWEKAGKPEGDGAEFWFAAKKELTPPPFEKSQALAEKIDKVVLECYLRGLMGNSKLPQEERAEVVKQALANLKTNASNLDLKEGPFGEELTEKARLLRPWADPSLEGKLHDFIHYAKRADHVQE